MRERKIRPACTIEGCAKQSRSGSSPYCEMHYGRIRFKSPLGMSNSETLYRHCGGTLTGDQRFYCSAQCSTFQKRGVPVGKTYKLPPAMIRLPEEEREWRAVTGFPLYEISNDGFLRRTTSNSNRKKGFIQKPKLSSTGYVEYGLYDPDKLVTHFRAHRLVATHFLPPPERAEQTFVLHKNDNSLDNRLTNLKWGTSAENTQDAILNGRIKRGKEHSSVLKRWCRQRGEKMKLSKLKEPQVLEILQSTKTHKELATEYKVDPALIGRIRQRKIWRHVTDPENFQREMEELKNAAREEKVS